MSNRNNHQRTVITQRDIQGEATKLKLTPPVIPNDEYLQRIVNRIYDDINSINKSVNQKMAANTDYSGKVGDIRIVPDPENPKNQLLQGRGANGWAQFGSSKDVVYKGKVPKDKPYDSGWFAIAAGNPSTAITLTHNLDTKVFKVDVLFKFDGTTGSDIGGEAANVNVDDIHYLNLPNVQGYGSGEDVGFGIVANSKTQIKVWTANGGLFYIDNYLNASNTLAKSGEMRIILTKIPLVS